MKNFDAFQSLQARIAELKASLPLLREELNRVEGRREELAVAAAKAKALNSPNAKKAAEEFEANEKRKRELRDEIESAEIELKGTEAAFRELEAPAVEEVRAKWRPVYERAILEFGAQLKKAAELERKALEIRKQADAELGQITIRPISALPPVGCLLVSGGGSPDNDPITRWMKGVKQDLGIDL